jgi:hypothetical protein
LIARTCDPLIAWRDHHDRHVRRREADRGDLGLGKPGAFPEAVESFLHHLGEFGPMNASPITETNRRQP